MGLDKSWTSRAVEGLVQEGLVKKVANPGDRRTIHLSLSEAGQARLTDLNFTLNTLAERAFEHIPTEQHEAVRAALELLQQALLTLTTEASASTSEDEGGAVCRCD